MLDYFALALLIFVALVLFYGIIAIHDIPYEIAKSREHPQRDAIHVAGWISLFTLHAIWPFLWIWATLFRKDRGWGFIDDKSEKEAIAEILILNASLKDTIAKLDTEKTEQISQLQKQMEALHQKIENTQSPNSEDA